MADGPSNFRSWQEEMDLNGEQEQRLLERAIEEARGTRQQAGRVLDDAGDDARQAQLREAAGGRTATTTVDRVGSYRDYVNLKIKAEGQYQAALRGGQGVTGMVRRQRAQQAGVNEAWTQQGDQQEAAEARALQQSASGAVGATRLAGEEKSRNDAKKAAEEGRRAEDASNKGKFNAELQRRMRGAQSSQDAYRASNNPFNPFRRGTNGFGLDSQQTNAFSFERGSLNPDQINQIGRDAYRGLEDNQQLAAMARRSGLGADADRFQSNQQYDAFGKRLKGGY